VFQEVRGESAEDGDHHEQGEPGTQNMPGIVSIRERGIVGSVPHRERGQTNRRSYTGHRPAHREQSAEYLPKACQLEDHAEAKDLEY